MASGGEIVLYHAVPSRSAIVRWMLEELEVPYRIRLLDLEKGEQKTPEHLALNPMGKVPVLTHGEAVATEAAAICCYLADAFSEVGLAVPTGDPGRGRYLSWLFFGPSCLEPAVLDLALEREPGPESAVGHGSAERMLGVLEAAVEKGPFLLGDAFTAADVVIGSGLHWGMLFGALPKRAAFVAYTERLDARPALRRAREKDAEIQAARAAKA